MKISVHADRTFKLIGIRAEDIHQWIDGLFDAENFELFLNYGEQEGYDPYDHRKFRHCQESLTEAYETFKGKYTKEQIKGVFECHIKDDYNGYLPTREDFENGTFTEKYHENDERKEGERILNTQELKDYFPKEGKEQKHRSTGSFSTAVIVRIIVPVFIAIILFITSIFIILLPGFKNNIMNHNIK